MKKHQKRWTVSEKLEIINYSKTNGVTKASREYNVSSGSIYKWRDAYEKEGESGLSKSKGTDSTALENRRLKRENDALKKLVAEKELRLRIQEEMLKKSR